MCPVFRTMLGTYLLNVGMDMWKGGVGNVSWWLIVSVDIIFNPAVFSLFPLEPSCGYIMCRKI